MKNLIFFMFSFLFVVCAQGQNATFNWVEEVISENNNLTGMTVTGDTSTVIVGHNNVFKKKTQKVQAWTDINAFDPEYDFIGMSAVGDITFMSSKRSKIINHPPGGYRDIFVSGVLLKSTNKGTNWSVLDVTKIGVGDDASVNPNADGGYEKDFHSVGAFNTDTFLVYSGWYDITTGERVKRGGVFLTKDGGEVWEIIVSGLGSNIITSIICKDSVALIGGSKSLYKTNIATNTTTDIYPNLAVGTDSNLYVSTITVVNTDSFYVTTTMDGIFRTGDGGETFTKLNGVSGGNDLYLLNDSSMIILGSSSKSKISTDYGTSWADCYPGKTCYKIGGVLGDTLYGLSKSVAYKIAVTDLLVKNFNWSTVTITNGENLQKMTIYDEDNAVIAAYGEVCKITSDGGKTWTNTNLPTDYQEDVEFDFTSISANGENAFSTIRRFRIANFPATSTVNDFYMEGLVLSTTDDWETVTLLDASKVGAGEGSDPTKNPQMDGCYGFNPYSVCCVDENTAYLYVNWYEVVTEDKANTRGRVFKTTDGGASWSAVTIDFGSSYINGISFIGDTGYIAGNKTLLKTTDGGNTYTDLYPTMAAANKDSSIFLKTVVLTNTNEFYIPTTSDGVFISKDGGNSFSKFEGISGANDFYKFDDNSFMCMGLTSKSFFTNNGGDNWQNASAGTTIYNIGEIFNDSLYTLGKGKVMKIALSDLDLKTAVKEIKLDNELSVRYKPLSIEIVSSENEIEQCKIYSITGKLVSVYEPNNRTYELQRSNFKPGIYIIDAFIKGKRHTEKIVF